jgi:hypothetical protein
MTISILIYLFGVACGMGIMYIVAPYAFKLEKDSD